MLRRVSGEVCVLEMSLTAMWRMDLEQQEWKQGAIQGTVCCPDDRHQPPLDSPELVPRREGGLGRRPDSWTNWELESLWSAFSLETADTRCLPCHWQLPRALSWAITQVFSFFRCVETVSLPVCFLLYIQVSYS